MKLKNSSRESKGVCKNLLKNLTLNSKLTIIIIVYSVYWLIVYFNRNNNTFKFKLFKQ